MKKRILSFLLVLLMVISLAPISALADKSDMDIAYPVEGGNIYFDKATGAITDCDESVTKADIPSKIDGVKVTSVRGSAFEGCKELASVTIPDGVTSIGSHSFSNCVSLPSINIPNGVRSISNYAFSGCASLASVEIPNSVTNIEHRAFEDCSSLMSIMIPDGVTSIDYAFYGCTSLANVDIPNSVTSIDHAFYGCTSLTSIKIPDNVTRVGGGAFSGCTSLTNVTIPNGVTSIEWDAFADCTSLVNINIPNSVTSIGHDAFEGCTSLASIDIPSSVTNIGRNVFDDCGSLTSINVEQDNPKYISHDGVLFTKDMSALIKCPSRKSGTYRIPEGVTSIEDGAFQFCANLTDIYIPSSVTSIGSAAFQGCESLQSIKIPEGVTSIGVVAFNFCGSITKITIPKSVTSIAEGAFSSCAVLKRIDVEDGNLQYASVDGVLFDKEKTVIIQYPVRNAEISYIVPDGIIRIGCWSFSDSTILASVAISDGVNSIGIGAFSGCTNIKDIYYSGSEAQWKNICIEEYNEPITNANIHYNHTHSYMAIVTAPTCAEAGYTTYTCSCGDSYKSDYKDALGHDYKDGICTRCGVKEDQNYKPKADFADVVPGAFYYNAVKWAVANDITQGVGNNKFDPDGSCTRAQVVTFLWRAAGKPIVSQDISFTDVAPGAYYYEAVKWAVANDITQGVGNNKFDPDGACTRGQVVTFLWRSADEPSISQGISFADVASGAYYYEAVKWAVANNITQGVGNNKFDPDSTCTRGQVVTFLYRAH